MPLSTEEWAEFDSYDWNADPEFTTGLGSVISAKAASGTPFTPDELSAVENRARLFFYSRKVQKDVTYEDYLEHIKDDTGGSKDTTPYPNSFAHIVELISSGKDVPGIRQIPNILLGETAASKSVQSSRRKPWER